MTLALLTTSASGSASAESVEGAPFKIASKTSRTLQKYTGLTWITNRVLSLGGSLSLKRVVGGGARVKVRTYSLTDALSGKLKTVEIVLRNARYKNIPLPELTITNMTPIQVNLKRGLSAPIMVSIAGRISESAISKALQSPEVTGQLGFLRLNLPGLGDQHLQVINPHIELQNGKVKVSARLITAGAAPDTGIDVRVAAEPVLKDERYIVLQGTIIESQEIVDQGEFSRFVEDLLNPLIDFGRFDRPTRAFRLTKLGIDKHEVEFAGKLLLAPRMVTHPTQTLSAPNK